MKEIELCTISLIMNYFINMANPKKYKQLKFIKKIFGMNIVSVDTSIWLSYKGLLCQSIYLRQLGSL